MGGIIHNDFIGYGENVGMMSPKVAVVILNWNGWQDTVELMESLTKAYYKSMVCIVIDNYSSNDSVKQIENWLQQSQVVSNSVNWDESSDVKYQKDELDILNEEKAFLLIKSDTNLGFCAGNNLGMEWGDLLDAKYLLILNNDTLVQPDFLQPMVDVVEQDERVGLVGGVITYCDNKDEIWWAGGSFDLFLNPKRLFDQQLVTELKSETAYETEWISGCMTLIPLKTYHKFGGYPEHYFIWGEEWDYSVQVKRAGYKLMVAPATRICHKVGQSLGVMKPLNYYYGIRNGLLFRKKFLPGYLWYPYFIYYLLNRAARYTQLLFQGRVDLVSAGLDAIRDFLWNKTGQWQRQEK